MMVERASTRRTLCASLCLIQPSVWFFLVRTPRCESQALISSFSGRQCPFTCGSDEPFSYETDLDTRHFRVFVTNESIKNYGTAVTNHQLWELM